MPEREKKQNPDSGHTDNCGHGCGHQLIGTGTLASVIALKDFMKEHNLKGTIATTAAQPKKTQAAKRFSYATAISMTVTSPLLAPGTGTTRMLRKHQSKLQSLLHIPRNPGTRSMCPELGRSALDAVELMDVGVNYMREHMIDEARIHYAITDTGGDAPNVVQSRAKYSTPSAPRRSLR